MVEQDGNYDLAKVTRFEVIDHRNGSLKPGRAFVVHGCKIELSYQDDGRTLKVFISEHSQSDTKA